MTSQLATTQANIPVKFAPTSPVVFDVNAELIDSFRDEYMKLKINGIDDKEGFDAVHAARMQCRKHRSTVESQRKEFKADALAYGRNVDETAKKIVALIEPVELHLCEQEDWYKTELARIRREAEEAKQRKVQQRLESLLAVGANLNALLVAQYSDEDFAEILAEKTADWEAAQVEAARIEQERLEQEAAEKAAREAESLRLKQEREQLEEQRRQLEQERSRQEAEIAKLQAEQKAREEEISRQRQEVENQRIELQRQEESRQLELRLQREREEAAEEARINAEMKAAAEQEAAERKALEEDERRKHQLAMRPDREKLFAVADACERLADGIEVGSDEAKKVLKTIRKILKLRADSIRDLINGM